MSKHMFSKSSIPWHVPVELVSAKENFNIETIMSHSLQFQDQMDILSNRKTQLSVSMWNYLGETIMRKLKNGHHSFVEEAERDLLAGKIGGHEAAQRIIDHLFS